MTECSCQIQAGDRIAEIIYDAWGKNIYKGIAETGIAKDGKVLVRWNIGTEGRVLASKIRRL